MRKTQNRFDAEVMSAASERMRAISHRLRIQILGFIDSSEETHVNKIYNTLGLEQSITSQHLRILRNADLVIPERIGKFVFYKVNYEEVEKILAAIRVYEANSVEETDEEE